MPHRLASFLLTPFVFAVLSAAPALAAGDASEGRRLAQQWCTSCHVVSDKTPGADAAPTFAALAADPAKTETYLRNWIEAPHPVMPNFNLTRQAAEDLAAYIRSLNPTKGKIER